MNRIQLVLDDEPSWTPPGDYWVVYGDAGWFHVSADVARAVERQLDRRWPPRWVTFRDVFGSALRIRTSLIHGVQESTAAQRAAERQLARARKAEERADVRPWEE